MTSIAHSRTTSTNDSDVVVLTAAAGELLEILYVHVVYTSTSSAGNRQLCLITQDDSDALVADVHAGALQAASLTYDYLFSRGNARETAVVDSTLQIPIPPGLVLLPGYDLRIKDNAAIDAAADDMTVNVVYRKLTIYQGNEVS